MNTWMKSVVVLVGMIAAGLMTGCASGTKFSEADLPPLASGQSRMIFYREGSPFGAAVQPEIKVNNEPVGKSQPNGFFFIDRAAGTYRVSCMTEWEHDMQVVLGPNDTQYIHTWVMMGAFIGHVVPEKQEAAKALKWIQDCAYTGVIPVTKKGEAATQPALAK